MKKYIFFDFDGVLVESVSVKTEAFRQLYLPYGEEIADKVVMHHQLNGGVSRFEKFRIYHKDFLGIELDDDGVKEMAIQFSNLVLDGVTNSEEVEGAFEFLDTYKSEFDYWIITGTPTPEIEIILDRKNWRHFFKGVHGSPTKKNVWTESIIKEYNLNSNEIVFIGDAKADYDAAVSSNVDFILRETEEGTEVFKDYLGPSITNITQLYETISKLNS